MDRDERSIPNLSISMEVNKFNKYPKYTHINELIIVIPCRQTVNFCVSYRISFDLYKQNWNDEGKNSASEGECLWNVCVCVCGEWNMIYQRQALHENI